MKALAEFLLRFVGFREALAELGWKPPKAGTQGGGGPPAPPAPKGGGGPPAPPAPK